MGNLRKILTVKVELRRDWLFIHPKNDPLAKDQSDFSVGHLTMSIESSLVLSLV